MIMLYLFGLGVLVGIIRYLLIPIITALKPPPVEVETLEDTRLDDEVAHLETLIHRNMVASLYWEKELETCINEKKRTVILSKLNTLDSQTFRYKQKINKLLEKLD